MATSRTDVTPQTAEGPRAPQASGRWRFRGILAASVALAMLLAACGDEGDEGAAAEDPAGEEVGAEQDEEAEVQGAFYDGDQVTLTVPYDTGGGTDITARFLAPLLSEHTPGNPSVQVQNEPGANTLIGSNFFAAAEPDGSRLFMSGAATSFNHVLAHPDAEFSYADWEPLLISPQGNIVYVASGIGVEEPGDILNPTEDYVLPVQSVEGSDLVRIITMDLLGLDFEVVAGYEGGGPARVAFEQGEANINGDTTSTYFANVQPMVDNGDAIPMYSFGFIDGDGEVVRDPAAPDLPHVGEVYEELHGSPPEGEMWDAYRTLLATYVMQKILWIQEDAPQEAIDAWLEGVENVLDDPEYEAGVEDVLEGYELITGSEMEGIVTDIANPPEDVVNWVYDYLETEHDTDIRP